MQVQLITTTTLQNYWTDGSLLWGSVFWLTVGGFAIIDDGGQCLRKGPVHSWSLTSYTTELWAILQVISIATGPIYVYTDYKTVSTHFHVILTTHEVNSQWPHQTWWTFIRDILLRKGNGSTFWFQISWIPLHICEHLPTEAISVELARTKKTTPTHIRINRLADHHAKLAADEAAIVAQSDESMLRGAILARQNWLISLHRLINTGKPTESRETQETDIGDLEIDHAKQLQNHFFRWNWNADIHTFCWKPKIPRGLANPCRADKFANTWKPLCDFAENLRWKICDKHLISYTELAVLFFLRQCSAALFDPDTTTIRNLINLIRSFFNIVGKLDITSLHPGVQTNLTKSAN